MRSEGRRRIYEITPEGRRCLQGIRERRAAMSARLDVAPLWAEVMGVDDPDEFLLERLRRTLRALEQRLSRSVGPKDAGFRSEVQHELSDSIARLRRVAAGGRARA